jgi:hypothetical protein
MQNRVIRPKDQLRMAYTVAGVEIVPLAAGHADPVLYPEQFVALLVQHAGPANGGDNTPVLSAVSHRWWRLALTQQAGLPQTGTARRLE